MKKKVIIAGIVGIASGVAGYVVEKYRRVSGARRVSFYEKYIKRGLDFTLSLIAIIILSPVFVVLTVTGAVTMRGNPFFAQERPGKDEKIFKVIKFRSMDNRKDKKGNLLPDSVRLNRYGKFLRATSLDEIPQLLNILSGDMAIIGPRPLRVEYLPYYTEEEKHRHDVRPGLTGLAQVHGRNNLGWTERFALDCEYVKHITFLGDCKIILETVKRVIFHSDVNTDGIYAMKDFDEERRLEGIKA